MPSKRLYDTLAKGVRKARKKAAKRRVKKKAKRAQRERRRKPLRDELEAYSEETGAGETVKNLKSTVRSAGSSAKSAGQNLGSAVGSELDELEPGDGDQDIGLGVDPPDGNRRTGSGDMVGGLENYGGTDDDLLVGGDDGRSGDDGPLL